MTYYQKVSELVRAGRLNIKLIVAPPRTSSTLLERSLSSSPDVNHAVHEPFIQGGYRPDGYELGYQHIYETVGAQIDSGDTHSQTIVVKELSQRLADGEESERLLSLVDGPVFFLIRNPLLTMESRIKKVAQTLNTKARMPTQQWMLDYYAKTEGYENWHSLANSSEEDPDDVRRLLGLYDQPDLEIQQRLLDHYAVSVGFSDWANLHDVAKQTHDYRPLGDILRIDPGRFIMDVIGKGSIASQIERLESHSAGAALIDGTDFRIYPEETLQALCSKWDIRYADSMVRWGEDLDLRRGQQEFKDLVWYDRLAASTAIEPPLDVPPPLAHFPDFVREHLATGDIPQYMQLYRHPSRIRVTGDYSLKKFPIAAHTAESNRVSLRNIDPLYSVLNEPTLAYDPEFHNTHAHHAELLELVHNIDQAWSPEGGRHQHWR